MCQARSTEYPDLLAQMGLMALTELRGFRVRQGPMVRRVLLALRESKGRRVTMGLRVPLALRGFRGRRVTMGLRVPLVLRGSRGRRVTMGLLVTLVLRGSRGRRGMLVRLALRVRQVRLRMARALWWWMMECWGLRLILLHSPTQSTRTL
ncbi:MAG: hypothetical protein WCS65_15705 [Verrucomicrobiae bacterium]